MTCPQAIDELKAIERCARSRGTPACDAIANRLAAVLEDPALLSALEDARRYRFIAADKSPAWEEELNAALAAAAKKEAGNG